MSLAITTDRIILWNNTFFSNIVNFFLSFISLPFLSTPSIIFLYSLLSSIIYFVICKFISIESMKPSFHNMVSSLRLFWSFRRPTPHSRGGVEICSLVFILSFWTLVFILLLFGTILPGSVLLDPSSLSQIVITRMHPTPFLHLNHLICHWSNLFYFDITLIVSHKHLPPKIQNSTPICSRRAICTQSRTLLDSIRSSYISSPNQLWCCCSPIQLSLSVDFLLFDQSLHQIFASRIAWTGLDLHPLVVDISTCRFGSLAWTLALPFTFSTCRFAPNILICWSGDDGPKRSFRFTD